MYEVPVLKPARIIISSEVVVMSAFLVAVLVVLPMRPSGSAVMVSFEGVDAAMRWKMGRVAKKRR